MMKTTLQTLALLSCVSFLSVSCSDKSLVPGDDPYYDDPEEPQVDQKLNEEEEYVDQTPTLNENEDGDTNEEYTMPPPSQYDE